MSFRILILIILFLGNTVVASEQCSKWFAKSNTKIGKDCLLNCAVIPVDLGTFDCPNECDKFCEEDYTTSSIFTLSSIYPGLTMQERALATESPAKMLSAYKLSWKVEELC